MKAVYTITGRITGLTAGRTVAYLTAPSNKVVELLSVALTNETNATNAQLQALIARITTLGSPTGFTAATPAKQEAGDQAATTTAAIGSTSSTEPTTYGDTLVEEGVPSLVGFRWEPNSPDERLYVAPFGIVGFKIGNVPVTGFDCAIKITFKEIG